MKLSAFAGLAALVLFTSAAWGALADPCEATVIGYRPGAVVAGSIRYVGDGDGLCIGNDADPTHWLEIRLADFFAPELHEPGGAAAKAALARFKGRPAVCVAVRGRSGSTRSYDRLIASCSVDGRPLAAMLSAAGVRQGGRGR